MKGMNLATKGINLAMKGINLAVKGTDLIIKSTCHCNNIHLLYYKHKHTSTACEEHRPFA